MEGVVHNIVSKIDVVLIKLEMMERSKFKRKANMGRILDDILDGNIHEYTSLIQYHLISQP